MYQAVILLPQPLSTGATGMHLHAWLEGCVASGSSLLCFLPARTEQLSSGMPFHLLFLPEARTESLNMRIKYTLLPLVFGLFEAESHYVAHAGPEFGVILLPPPPKWWDYRCVP